MAFVQSVTGKKPDAGLLSPASETARAPVATTLVNVEAVLAAPAPIPVAVPPKLAETKPTQATPAQPKPLQIAGLDLPADFQSEIRARVASFRAHQARFTREREEYCRVTMAKVRATLSDDIEPPSSIE
jgi:hypothetical protein